MASDSELIIVIVLARVHYYPIHNAIVLGDWRRSRTTHCPRAIPQGLFSAALILRSQEKKMARDSDGMRFLNPHARHLCITAPWQ
ncbi:hypothetical protein JTE90_024355 [Oedothorax gibbosus]|uniref:Uncharacterized protein n=1 Tax=Oedothorax gibbosus TaxID=931172 RepID=A0AAV6VXZ8_9ARAC|nr:hypothetical protein JTE90_024355 [Oedothorax gibbosus]